MDVSRFGEVTERAAASKTVICCVSEKIQIAYVCATDCAS